MVTNKDTMQFYLKAIHKATASVMESAKGLDETLKKICAAIISIPNYNRALIAEFQEDSQNFVVLAYGGLGTKLLNSAKRLAGMEAIGTKLRITEQENIFIQAVKECKILTSNDLYQITRPVLNKKVSQALAELLNISSYAAVPLCAGYELVGGMLITSKVLEITNEEMEALETFADAAALAIQRVKEQERLSESEERYRQLVELSPDAIAVHSEGMVVFVNSAAVKLLGATTPEELVGEQVMDFVHPDYREIVMERIRQMTKKDIKVPLIEEKFIRVDGTEVDVEVAAMPFTHQGKPAVQVVIRDITMRRQMAEEIEERQKYLESVLYSAPEAIVTLDASHGLIEWNPGAEKIFGYTHNEVLGKNIDDLITNPEVRNGAVALTKQVLSGDNVLPQEVVRYRKDGTPVNAIVAGSPIQIGDDLIGVVAVYTDITEQKRMEKELSESHTRMQILQQITAAIHSTLDLEKVFKQITDGVVYSLGYTTAFILKLTDEKKYFEIKAFSTKKRIIPQIEKILGFSYRNFSFMADPEINATIRSAMKGNTIVAKTWDEIAYPLISKKKCSALQKLGRTKNCIVVPLKVENEVVGGVVITSSQEEVSEEELQMIQIFARAASNAIQNADLHMQTKLAEEALQESEEMYKTLVETSPDAVTVTDLEGNITYVSARTLELHGYDHEEELLGRNAFELIDPEDHEVAASNILETLKEGIIENVEYTFRRKDGTRFVGELSATLINDAHGKPKTFIATTRDITERKRAEDLKSSIYKISEAVHSAQNLAELFSLIHHIVGELMLAKNFYIALYDPASKILSFPYFVDEYDDTPAPKKLSKGMTEYVLRTGRPLLASPKVFGELVKKGEVEQIGTPAIDWLGVPLKTENKTIGILVTQSYTKGIRFGKEEKDILIFVSDQVAMAIERKWAEEELKAAQEYSWNLINSSLDMIISVDKKRRIVEFNPAAQKTFGYSKDDVLGKHINILYADPTEGLKAHKTARKKGRFSGEILNKRKNGETFPSFLSASVLWDEDGEFMGVMGVSRDISERIKIRNELENAIEQTEQANRVKTLFLANMSHEIRTPLNSMLGFIDLLKKNLHFPLNRELRTFFNIIQHSGERLMQTVHKILDISQIEAGTLDLNPKLLDLMELTEKTVKEFKPMAKNKGLKLSYLSKVEYAVVRADEYCITSALSNLIDNALKYTEKGKVDVTLKGIGKNLSLTIKDTGIGISGEYMEHLFEIFSQESMGYTKKFQGVGLGLALTKQYLDMNNVSLDVQSTKDQGTTFILTFKLSKGRRPQVEAKLKEELPVEPLQKPREKPLVLLVEDDIASQKLTSFFIKSKYDTCFAISVAEAKERLKKQAVGLILLDLSLYGDEDGLDLARYVRKTKKWREIPIVAVTAHAFTTDQTNCLAAGCNDYLAKPIKQDELLAKLKQYIPISI